MHSTRLEIIIFDRGVSFMQWDNTSAPGTNTSRLNWKTLQAYSLRPLLSCDIGPSVRDYHILGMWRECAAHSVGQLWHHTDSHDVSSFLFVPINTTSQNHSENMGCDVDAFWVDLGF